MRRKSLPSRNEDSSTASSSLSSNKNRSSTNLNLKKKKSKNHPVSLNYGRNRLVSRKILVEIRNLQLTTKNCIPKLPFGMLIREILMNNVIREDRSDMRVQRLALEALQEAAEVYLTTLYEDSNMCAAHARRITLKPNDMNLVLTLRGGDMSPVMGAMGR